MNKKSNIGKVLISKEQRHQPRQRNAAVLYVPSTTLHTQQLGRVPNLNIFDDERTSSRIPSNMIDASEQPRLRSGNVLERLTVRCPASTISINLVK